MKVKWIVAPKPTGRYRSFEKRGWPHAEYEDGQYAGSIVCTDQTQNYVPSQVKTGNHPPLKVRVYDYSGPQRASVITKTEYKTLAEAKEVLAELLHKFPHFIPTKRA